MSHRQNLKSRIIANRKSQLMQFDSRKLLSGNTVFIQPFIENYQTNTTPVCTSPIKWIFSTFTALSAANTAKPPVDISPVSSILT